jgi:tRNA modification GTPase
MIVANQLDRLDDTQRRQALEDLRRLAGEVCGSECGLHAVSARTGEGLDELRAVLAERLDLKTPRPGEALMLHGRQRRAFLAAAEAAGRAADLLGSAAELAAAEVRLALEALGEVTGSTAEGRRREDTEEVLGRIFSRFCVGK